MARITTEDCEHLVDGRFELVILAGERTKQLESGEPCVVEAKHNKPHVRALRELKFLKIEDLRAALIARHQKHAVEEYSDQDMAITEDLIAEETGMGFMPGSEEDMGMFSEEGYDSGSNLFADDDITDDEDK